MSDDIKARLREVYYMAGWEGKFGVNPSSLQIEAADRIEALEAENARLTLFVCSEASRAAGYLIGIGHAEEGQKLKDAIDRAALAQDNPTRDQGAGDQGKDAE